MYSFCRVLQEILCSSVLSISFQGSFLVLMVTMAWSRDSEETAVNNRLQDIAEKGRHSDPQDQEPQEVGFLNKNLRPVVFDVVKNIAITSTLSIHGLQGHEH